MVLGPATQEILDQIVGEINKPENQDKIKNGMVDPLINYLHSKVFVYLQFLGGLMGLIILLLVMLICIQYKK